MKSQHLYRSLLAISVLAAAPLVGSAQITRFEIAGIPQVVRATTGGFSGGVDNGNKLGYNTTTDRIHWHDNSSGGASFFWLDPTVFGDLGASPNALTGQLRHYNASNTELYGGTVTGGVKTSYTSGTEGFAYVPDTNSMFNLASTGNNGPLVEYQPARSDSGSDLVGEGTTGDMTNSAREVSRVLDGLTTGDHKSGLAYLGDDGSNYEFLVIDNRDSISSQEGVKIDVFKTFSTAPTATTSGVRDKTIGGEGAGAFVTNAELNSLVPGVDDLIKDLANDLSGNIYAVSADGTNNYLSAFSFDDTDMFTQIDLDPNSAALHVDLMDLITDNAGTEIAAVGLTVNGDASKIYISANNSSGTTLDNIFIFDQVVASAAVPEPASIAIWSLLGLALAGFCCLRARRKI